MLPALFQPGDPGLTAPKCSSWQGGDRLRSSPRRNSPSDLGLEDGPDDDDEDDCALWQPDCNCLFALALLLRSHSGATSRTPWLPRAKPTVPSRPGLPSRPSLERKRERLASLTSSSLCVLTCALVPHSFSEGKDTRAEEHLHFQGARLDPTAEGSHRDRSIESRRASEESEPAAKPRCRQVKTERPASRRPAKKRQPGCPQSPQCTLTAFSGSETPPVVLRPKSRLRGCLQLVQILHFRSGLQRLADSRKGVAKVPPQV